MTADDVSGIVEQLKLLNEKVEAIAVALRAVPPAPIKLEGETVPSTEKPTRDVYNPQDKI